MSKAKQLKIREALKKIYDLYSEVDDFLFTTYNYDTDFFSDHIIAYLMEFDRKFSTIDELNAANDWIQKNNVSVYYDKDALSPGISCLTIPIFPQNVKIGVFHPKIVVIYGKLKESNKEFAHLFVSSCNLTVSGYGRNKEAFACVEITSRQLGESLSKFIGTLTTSNKNIHSNLLKYLNSLHKENDDIEFIWTNSDKGTKLIDYLAEKSFGDLTIVSPYFDESGPKKLLDRLINKKKTTIVPAIDGETYNIHKKDYEELISQNIIFSELENDSSSRFVHAKIFKFGKQVFIGSYNFTSAALCGKNAEATLVFNKRNDFNLNLTNFSESKLLNESEEIINRDENKINSNIFVSLTAKWKEKKIEIFTEGLNDCKKYQLRIDGFSKDLSSDLSKSNEIELTFDLENHLFKHKSFTVYENGTICFKGLINEIDVKEFRPDFHCETLEETIKEWFVYSNDESKSSRNQLLIYTEDEETENVLGVSQKNTSDIFDNYYVESKSFENLLQQIQIEKKKTNNDLFGFLTTKTGSLENMIELLKKDNLQKDIVYKWLFISYIKSVLELFPKNINQSNKVYKEKLLELSNETEEIQKSIERILLKKIDKKYLKWIESEFYKKDLNV